MFTVKSSQVTEIQVFVNEHELRLMSDDEQFLSKYYETLERRLRREYRKASVEVVASHDTEDEFFVEVDYDLEDKELEVEYVIDCIRDMMLEVEKALLA